MSYCIVCNQRIEIGEPATTNSEGRPLHLRCTRNLFVRQPWQP